MGRRAKRVARVGGLAGNAPLPARQELTAILTIRKRRAKDVELILARRSPSTEGRAAEPPPPCQVCCAHVFLPVYPSGPRDNGEFESRCEKCGLPEFAR